ncbi:MAG: hypothetical protein LKF01_04150 [Lactobacillus sp.]|jgi:hypothetical protein|nr:hypothetical protein [Lactobacillus sp.]MCH3905811.1 hypothetical protein [Lactobacillus sp.]MCH3990608.1 hypothetical protein [Lactobacillus sp.]MCH4068676.1 hypothetical protein [Lactobacillus sp.]MCI1303839.1 hypothetical protein [Lactobacillus sp.]
MKKLCAFLLALTAFITMAFAPSRVKDPVQILDPDTMALVNDKDIRYERSHDQPQIYLQTQQGIKITAPKHATGNRLYIMVGIKGNRANVKVYRGSGIKKWLSQEKCDQLVVSQSSKLKPKNEAAFNKALRKIIKGLATLVEDHYGISHDSTSLGKKDVDKMVHPHRTSLPFALGVGVVVFGLFWFARNRKLEK